MKRILVVDDDQDSCELLREIFSSECWYVDTALSPTQAFSQDKKEKIDLLQWLMDLTSDLTEAPIKHLDQSLSSLS